MKKRLFNLYMFFLLLLGIAAFFASTSSNLKELGLSENVAYLVGKLFSILLLIGIVIYYIWGKYGIYFIMALFALVAVSILLFWLFGWCPFSSMLWIEICCILTLVEIYTCVLEVDDAS